VARIIDLEWDRGSVKHIAEHEIEPEEVEAVLRGRYLLEHGRWGRYYLLGQTEEGRYLFIVLARKRSGRYRVITARDMMTNERRRFRKKVKRQ